MQDMRIADDEVAMLGCRWSCQGELKETAIRWIGSRLDVEQ